jgi:hypothetical protein
MGFLKILGLIWVCFGFELGLIGFVLPVFADMKIFITAYCRIGCVYLGLSEIGFVLHNQGDL